MKFDEIQKVQRFLIAGEMYTVEYIARVVNKKWRAINKKADMKFLRNTGIFFVFEVYGIEERIYYKDLQSVQKVKAEPWQKIA